jgi:polyisoprenoid-binding protein YceI
MMMNWRTWAIASTALLVSASAGAVEYGTVLPEKSSVNFVFKQMGVPVNGRFGRFAVQMTFDPAKPEQGRAVMEIDIASIDAGSDEANDEARKKGWFNTPAFPKAVFTSSSVKPLGGNRYELAGKLSIKGRTQEVKAPLTFKQEGANAQFDGALNIKRLQFAIGEGIWSDVETVADDVQVKFRVVAAAKK